ncbi:CS1 type fimbrial major subunit [Pandoraea oxalativorans]|uniref:CFA/I fimbrial subunit B n=1 Tax=Pandoraea oxalativorans TaxID=573737 RepID=A0A192B1V3_9BURK|nr:CS1 type fimbrial major subunit [Pandoraea oxalativorans]ANJ87203.1 hypothetical protein MB84_31250 [Pandoraea oxalativorans]
MKTFKQFAAVMTLVVPMAAAHAAEVVIDLSANIDPTLSVLQANGSPMPQNLDLSYNAATRDIAAPTIQTRLFTNDATQNIQVRLGTASSLVHATNSTVAAIPLTVQLDGRTITTAATTFNASDVWSGSGGGESRTLALTVAGRAPGTDAPVAGRYVGRLDMVILASAAAGT